MFLPVRKTRTYFLENKTLQNVLRRARPNFRTISNKRLKKAVVEIEDDDSTGR